MKSYAVLLKCFVPALSFFLLSAPASSDLIDRGGGMIYDDVLNVTWLQDAVQGNALTWYDAEVWADTLVFGGFDDWRMPLMDVNLDGTIVDCNGASEAECRDNELGYMYYHNLGGSFLDDLTGDQGLIQSLHTVYWSGTDAPDTSRAWWFAFANGAQAINVKFSIYAAWAVRSGDVGAPDSDADGVFDSFDNCILVANPDQHDSNADAIGNFCDPDITGPVGLDDCLVNFLDLNEFKAAFFSNPSSINWNPDADMNNDGIINFLDLTIVQQRFFVAPGPSANGCN